jgi:hypothetical protein
MFPTHSDVITGEVQALEDGRWRVVHVGQSIPVTDRRLWWSDDMAAYRIDMMFAAKVAAPQSLKVSDLLF